MPHRAEAIGIVFDRVHGGHMMTERCQTMRKPGAAGAEIENRAWLARRLEHMTEQVSIESPA